MNKSTPLPEHKTFPLLFILILLGSALRLILLGSVPGGMHQDEAFVAWNAYAMVQEGMDSAGHIWPVYMADWGDGHSALYVWLLMPLIALNGGHVNAFLSRLPQALVSIASLLAVYGLVKRSFDARKGLLAMFLLAICPWHIMMSRWGLDANLAPGFLLFGLYFFLRGLDEERYLVLSAFFYGLSLYSYAVIWPCVPFMLLLQSLYALYHKKIKVNVWTLASALLLFAMALPLLFFILVNSDIIPEITLPFLTIPKMGGYRGGEIAFSLSVMWKNLRTTLSLLWHQNTGSPFDILLPWGLFYDIGRIFTLLGGFFLTLRTLTDLVKKRFSYETFLMIPLMGGGLTVLLVSAILHQINALYIPLDLCQAYGIWVVAHYLRSKKELLSRLFLTGLVAVYLLCLVLFQRDYYTDYRQLVGAYFAIGVEESVDYALSRAKDLGIDTITVEKGAQWPRILLYTETLPSEYLSSVVYDVPPAPASFRTKEILFRTRINYENITKDSIYILYYTDTAFFEESFTLTPFYDWYVAVPKQESEKH